ncbi:MAG TPA: tetratricopeptide repeat protein [Thermoanaerobaculia bacterium]|nr:tetratricopeptide repeat protein [Thermoanaerobaculia bacterium]
MILAAALVALSISPGLGPSSASGDGGCADDPAAIAAEADALIADAGPTPDAATLEQARRLYRRVRVLAPSAVHSLRAADLACAAGDDEECGDLLSQVAEGGASLLSPADRLLLARRSESRRAWREAISHYRQLRVSAADAGVRSWAEERIRRLEVEAEAQSIAAPAAMAPPPEARLALGEARQALGAGNFAKARERLSAARRLSPDWPEAALVLAALETREGRVPEAIRAYRDVLAADPGRFEALVGLANLLWDEPDRSAKEEALAATDRAVESRPEALALVKTSALRWAEWGDAPKALARLDAYRRRATADEKRATEALRETLARRVDAILSGQAPSEEPDPAQLSSPAVDEWKVAQAYLRRGDPESLLAALDHLREAERLDPAFAPAPELAGTIYEKRGELSLAQSAYERAISADPTRPATYERLAFLLARQGGRDADAEEAWRRAEQAGSSEALFRLAESASRKGRRGEALAMYRRYLAESPGGVHAEEASRSIAKLETRRRSALAAGGAIAALLLVAAGIVLYRRSTGRTFEEWIRRFPGRARDARPIVGRLRHEVVKHGGLLLADGARKLSGPDPEAMRRTAALLRTRLFGDAGSRGLVRESSDAFARLQSLAREDGIRLDLSGRDPLFSPIAGGSRILEDLESPLSRAADGDPGRVGRIVARLERAADLFRSTRGAEISRLLEEASSTRTRFADLLDLAATAGAERSLGASIDLEPLGLFSNGSATVAVRVGRVDWETIWRNLFANALAAAGAESSVDLRLGVSAEIARDPITGTPIARFVLADNLAAPLTTEMIRGRAADRGWGVVADLVRRNDGFVDIGPPPTPAYRKGIVLEVPAVESRIPA